VKNMTKDRTGKRCLTVAIQRDDPSLGPEQLLARPIPGRWSTQEVVCHVSDCEQFYADRLKRTLAMDRPLLLGSGALRRPGCPEAT
jgi:hypothetical protein